MFNVGGGELIVILLVALIVLGPQRLPGAARQLGKTMGDLRRLSSGFQDEVRQALETADEPHRVAGRRNVLATELEPRPPTDQAVTDSIASVNGQGAPAAPSEPSEPPAPQPEP
jgi:sec-independent protein translocase protein TatB